MPGPVSTCSVVGTLDGTVLPRPESKILRRSQQVFGDIFISVPILCTYCELDALSISLKIQSNPTIGQLGSGSVMYTEAELESSTFLFPEGGGTHREVTEKAKAKNIIRSIVYNWAVFFV